VDGAIREYQLALVSDPRFSVARFNLGNTLLFNKQDADGAIREHRLGLASDPKDRAISFNLAIALKQKGRLDEAIAALQEAARLDPRDYGAHGGIGELLLEQGRFAEARQASQEALRLLPAGPDSQRRILEGLQQNCERFIALEGKLAAILRGEGQPRDAAERIGLAQLCQRYKRRHALAAHFFAGAFARKPELAGDLKSGSRYNAACCAALAGCGQGQEAGGVTPMQRQHWRRQALTWLRADLRAWQQLLAREPVRARAAVAQKMQHWLADTDFNGVRGADALARLPAEESAAWARLWSDVADLLSRTKEPMPTDKEKPDKP
jgi:hypothetical protein